MRNGAALYLGAVAVVPRSDLTRHFELPMVGGPADDALRAHVESVVSLPRTPQGNEGESGRALDILISKFQGGGFFEGTAGDFWLPFFWRPKVEISARLYTVKGRKTLATVTATKRMAWRAFLGRVASVGHLFSFSSPFTRQDMTDLLDEALFDALIQVKEKL
jgi:hypothetical protein